MDAKLLRTRVRKCWHKDIRPGLVLLLILMSIRSSLADWNDVPSGSMKPTILEGDRVFVNKLAYDLKIPFTTWHIAQWGNPKRGEIVVFYSPKDGKRLIKRVIGLPGDTVEMRNNVLFLNGSPVDYSAADPVQLRDVSFSDLLNRKFATEHLPGRPHAVAATPSLPALRAFTCEVPEGHYFMMGDNRDDSFDSRYYGPVERKRIVGHATGIAFSLDRQHQWRPRSRRFFSAFDVDHDVDQRVD